MCCNKDQEHWQGNRVGVLIDREGMRKMPIAARFITRRLPCLFLFFIQFLFESPILQSLRRISFAASVENVDPVIKPLLTVGG